MYVGWYSSVNFLGVTLVLDYIDDLILKSYKLKNPVWYLQFQVVQQKSVCMYVHVCIYIRETVYEKVSKYCKISKW